MDEPKLHITGLNEEEVAQARATHGTNVLHFRKESGLLVALKDLVKEPMILLLLAAAAIYFFSGEYGDGIFLAASVIFVAAISLYQENRSRKALHKLREFSQPNCTVMRNGKMQHIKSAELVLGDVLVVEEGTAIAADGLVLQSNDFSVDESILTGESMPVFKDPSTEDRQVYLGTTVASGLAMVRVNAIGNQARLGKIGKSLEDIGKVKSPLEQQINDFVRKMVIIGAVVFLLVWTINFLRTGDIVESLLRALTLAMSILPEEIPVAFTTFMALGSWQLMKMGIVVKQIKTVESLGSATVICTDKTGTLTENRMSLAACFVMDSGKLSMSTSEFGPQEQNLVRLAMWASEPIPFDPMELALHEAYQRSGLPDQRPDFHMRHEYPLGGKPPMMTHIFQNASGQRIIAAKGAPEALMAVSGLSEAEQAQVEAAIDRITREGYRVLGVGEAQHQGDDFPKTQQEFRFRFHGLVAFYDPPKANIAAVLQDFYQAGISVRVITGDNALTTASIARQIGLAGYENSLSGDQLMQLDAAELQEKVRSTMVFTRMFPEAKLRIIEAMKSNREVVAMVGDGVNDGPALKAAHIGIAMGKKGTEIAKQAAALVLVQDDLSRMVDAIAIGRTIYDNLKKAIRYIISIHIPIILTVFLPLALGWVYPNIFSPAHVIILELIMGPTCSIIFQREPMEKGTMYRPPRPVTSGFLSRGEMLTSVLQGLVITAGIMGVYQWAVWQGHGEAVTRTMVFLTLIFSNVFLTLVNRSFHHSLLTTLRYRNPLIPLIIGVTLVLAGVLVYVGPAAVFLGFEALDFGQVGVCAGMGLLGVGWYEGVKWRRRKSH